MKQVKEFDILSGLDRLLEPNEFVINIVTHEDSEGNRTLETFWRSNQVGRDRNILGNRGQVQLSNLDELLKQLAKENKIITILPNKFLCLR